MTDILSTIRLRSLIMATLLILGGCSNSANPSSESIPEDLQPNWEQVDIDKIPVRFGEQLKFEIDNRELDGIVVDFDQDEGGTWIGLCLLNDNQLFGRQIPNGLINTTCLDLLDISYIHLDGLNGYVIKDTLDLDIRKIGIGSISPVRTTKELFRNFEFGIERRKLPQTPCDQGITALDPVRECYFEIERIIR